MRRFRGQLRLAPAARFLQRRASYPEMRFFRSLYLQVLLAIMAGVLLGHFQPDLGTALKPLGDAFIKLIKMLIGPIIFTTVVAGIGGMGDLKSVGRVGLKALVYFEVVTTAALVIGMVVANTLLPGVGVHATAASLDPSAVAGYAKAAASQSTVEWLLHLIPNTLVSAFVEGDVLQVLLVALRGGEFADLHRLGGKISQAVGF